MKKITFFITSKKDSLIFIFIILILFLLHTRNISQISSPTILDDEFGYWSIAAHFAGFDWSNITQHISYYSYGYSLFLLPLFFIFDNIFTIYQASIVLNSLLLSSIFLLSYSILKKLSYFSNKNQLIASALLISSYPSYFVNSSVAWSESLLVFFAWFLTWLFVRIDKNASIINFIFLGFSSVYIYTIHQRAVGILVSVILVLSLMKIGGKISIKQFVTTICIILFLFILHSYVKEYVQTNVWLNSISAERNDYSSQLKKFSSLPQINSLFKYLKAFTGQFFYLGLGSFLLTYFGLFEVIKNSFNTIISTFQNTKNALENTNNYFYLFIFLAFTSSFLISVIFLKNPIRIDHIFFGRYFEMIIGPLYLVGLSKFFSIKNLKKSYCIYISIAFFLISVTAKQILDSSNLTFMAKQNVVALVLINFPLYLGIFLPVIISICAFILLYYIYFHNKQKILSLLILLSLFSFFTGKLVTDLSLADKKILGDFFDAKSILEQSHKDVPIYILSEIDTPQKNIYIPTIKRFRSEILQFYFYNKPIKILNSEKLKSKLGDKFIIGIGDSDIIKLSANYETFLETSNFTVFVPKKSKLLKLKKQ